VVNCTPGAIETVLKTARAGVMSYKPGAERQIEEEEVAVVVESKSNKKQGHGKDESKMAAVVPEKGAKKDKDATIRELQQTVSLLQTKVEKLEQLIK